MSIVERCTRAAASGSRL